MILSVLFSNQKKVISEIGAPSRIASGGNLLSEKCANVETIIGAFQCENILQTPNFTSQVFEQIPLVDVFRSV